MSQLHLITGGQRSGKSRYAQSLAETRSAQPIYLATAQWDNEPDFTARIRRHQFDRGDNWQTVEMDSQLSECQFAAGSLVLVDCVTLWLSRLFFADSADGEDASQLLQQAKADWQALEAQPITILAVTNEIGLGVIPADKLSRRFVDLQGWTNQWLAARASQVTFMVSGLPLQLK